MWNAIGGVVIIAYNAVAGIAIFSLLKVLKQILSDVKFFLKF